MKRRLLKLSLMASLGLASTTGAFAVDNKVVLDTLIIYSQGAEDSYQGDVKTRIDHLVETTNKIYQDSGLNAELNPMKIQKYDMNDSLSSSDMLSIIQQDKKIAKLRDDLGADNVVIYRPYAHDLKCGVAYKNLRTSADMEDFMYAHVTIGCGGYVTAHEVGHNSGLGHSVAQESVGIYPYARGYGVDKSFATVMAYGGAYHVFNKVYKYSSPDLVCTDGQPCGVAEGEEKQADAVKALKKTLPIIANLRKRHSPDDNSSNGNEELDKALQAYNAQKAKVEGLIAQAKVLKTDMLNNRDNYAMVVVEYKERQQEHFSKRDRLRELKESGTRAEIRSYYNNVYKPSALALKAYKKDVKDEAKKQFVEARKSYTNYIKSTLKPEKAKLAELEKAYNALKNN